MTSMLTRRRFLERLTIGSAVLGAARLQAATPMYVSLNGSMTRQMPWPDFVRLAGKLGYGGVDVALGAAMKDGVEATRALLASSNVKPSIANLPFQFATPDDAAFQTGLDQLGDAARFLEQIGCPRLMAVLSPGSQVPREERHPFIKARVTAIAKVLQPTGVRLGLEFLGPLHFRSGPKTPHQYIWTMKEAVALAQECGPSIGVVLDAWHWHHSGSTIADIHAAGKTRVVHIHVSDAKAQPPEEVRDNQRLMPGEGVIDLVGFFQALQKIGYEDAVSPEPLGRVPAEMSPEDGARLGLDTTKTIMKKAGLL